MNFGDLRQFPLLKEIDSEGLDALADWLERQAIPAGASIFEEGERSDALVLVAAGTIRLESSRSQRAARVKSGSALGGVSLIAGGMREATATAETDCELLLLSETAFQMLLEDAPRVACQLTGAIGRELATCARHSLNALSSVAPGHG